MTKLKTIQTILGNIMHYKKNGYEAKSLSIHGMDLKTITKTTDQCKGSKWTEIEGYTKEGIRISITFFQ